jgi:uncharacterized repeat protein (TIGR01451 family)
MKINNQILLRILLAGLLVSCGIAAVGATNLTIEKNVIDWDVDAYPIGNVTWKINVTNLNTTDAVDINVTEILPPGCEVVKNITSEGDYSDRVWNLTVKNETTEYLTLTMNCTLSCDPSGSVTLENRVEITTPDPEEDDDPSDNNDTSTIEFPVPTCYDQITVKPETLNLKTVSVNGNGVATVFITVGDRLNRTDLDPENIDIKCNNASPDKILFNEKDNGTLMLKFRRGDLEFDPVDQTAWINCSGTIELQDGTLEIEGGDEVRVTHAEAIQSNSLFERLLQFLGITSAEEGDVGEDGTGDGAITPSIIPEDVKNFGQLKKVLQIQKQDGSSEDDTEITPSGNGNGKGKEKKNPNLETEDENENGSNGKGKGTPPEDVPARGKNK